ncbi:MAG: alanine racemase, partial [bacterium]|nr:alanine racemase [bacterium]
MEPGKSGFDPRDFRAYWPELARLPHLAWQGLMCIPPPQEDPEKVRPFFRKLKSLLDECNQSGLSREPLKDLSMGMSQDFEVAIEEGATMVRVGTALFGSRT